MKVSNITKVVLENSDLWEFEISPKGLDLRAISRREGVFIPAEMFPLMANVFVQLVNSNEPAPTPDDSPENPESN